MPTTDPYDYEDSVFARTTTDPATDLAANTCSIMCQSAPTGLTNSEFSDLRQKIQDADKKPINKDALMKYAFDIVADNSSFEEFATTMMDYVGRPCSEIIECYDKLIEFNKNLIKEGREKLFELEENFKERYGSRIIDVMTSWFFSFESAEKRREAEEQIKEDIDELNKRVKKFRTSNRFKKMIDFISNFPNLSSYNAYLVSLQKPGATFVLSLKEWIYVYGRRPKINGQQLLILMPFRPIQIMVDYSDTEPIPGRSISREAFYRKKEKEIEEWEKNLNNANIRNSSEQNEEEIWGHLKENLPKYGIALHEDFNAGGTFGGYLQVTRGSKILVEKLSVEIAPKTYIEADSAFIINVNKDLNIASKFHTVCHELGHLFCRHLSYDGNTRHLSTKEEEFEAETVAWLVGKRRGIENPSEEYLANYAQQGELPACALSIVLKAVDEIERIIDNAISVKKGMWYEKDKAFRALVDGHAKNRTAGKDPKRH
ncbi:MAG: hypothetical protein LUE27_00040 [Clostridia bacterium]|nr:hypothetical protein [Clostridia bacterium]